MKNVTARAAILAAAPLLIVSCYDYDDDDDGDFNSPPSTVASDFQSLSDYLSHPVVQHLLSGMPRHPGTAPPNVGGSYEAAGFVTTPFPGGVRGDPFFSRFCFGVPAGEAIEVINGDPGVVDGGAGSAIEGAGNAFTVYTAFKSILITEIGTTCEMHMVAVYSGFQNPNGSLSDLRIGSAIVGFVGDCFPFLVGDIQIADTDALRVGPPCNQPGGGGPGPNNPANVLVTVENNLVTELLVFLGASVTPVLQVPPLATGSFETGPGFVLAFESLQPSAGQDNQGNELLMGEIVLGEFAPDVTPGGGSITYIIENVVGSEVFFAPLPVNQSAVDIFSVTNQGVNIPGYPPPPGSGLDCLCIMPPSVDNYMIGYYSYSVPGVISPSQANVRFFDLGTGTELSAFPGPFNLSEFSGTVTLLVR
jgi:hypothetical protein